jgi:hypothetical protein
MPSDRPPDIAPACSCGRFAADPRNPCRCPRPAMPSDRPRTLEEIARDLCRALGLEFAGINAPPLLAALREAREGAERERDEARREAVEMIEHRLAEMDRTAMLAAEQRALLAESERDALAEALRGACDVWFGRTLYPTFSGEKQRRMDVAMEAARAALNGARHAE